MKICLVSISLRGGGTERIVTRIANHLATRHQVTIVTLTHGEAFYPLDTAVEILSPRASLSRSFKLLRVLRQLGHLFAACRRSRPDQCFVFGEDIAGIGALAVRLAGVPWIRVFFRGTPERSIRGVNGLINPVLCQITTGIVVQTEAARLRLAGSYPLERISVWPNPIEVPLVSRRMSERDRLVLNVGSIGRSKNQQGLIRIFNSLECRDGWRLVFIGDGPNRNALQRQVESQGGAGQIRFGGQVKQVGPELDRAAIFAFTSLSEGFPNALAEALAAGCACISFDCPTGPNELIQDGVNGFLVPLGDEALFALRLQQLMDDEALRASFSAAGRASMKRFEVNATMKQLEAMIGLGDMDSGAPCVS